MNEVSDYDEYSLALMESLVIERMPNFDLNNALMSLRCSKVIYLSHFY